MQQGSKPVRALTCNDVRNAILLRPQDSWKLLVVRESEGTVLPERLRPARIFARCSGFDRRSVNTAKLHKYDIACCKGSSKMFELLIPLPWHRLAYPLAQVVRATPRRRARNRLRPGGRALQRMICSVPDLAREPLLQSIAVAPAWKSARSARREPRLRSKSRYRVRSAASAATAGRGVW